MFLAVHAAIGALAGNAVGHPTAAFALGFVSHFFTDMVPHGDEHMYEGYKNGNKVTRALLYVGADALCTVLLIALFFLKQDFFHPVSVALGIAGSLLPDLMVGLAEIMKPKKRSWFNLAMMRFHGFHMQNHHFLIKHVRKEKDIPFHYGLALQGATLTFLMIKIF
jgi:xanthine/uracil permease